MSDARWVRGDLSGLAIPANLNALADGGAGFLSAAFQAPVARIRQCEECFGGGTGAKALLAVEYAVPCGLPEKLFVKFSRNFGDPIRDRSRHMMTPEVKFAALSAAPGFPITVPQCQFADVNIESGTGLIITERLAFGSNGVEPLYAKCMDHEVPQALEHYEAIIKALARLSGSHKAGRLDARFDEQFPFDLEWTLAADPIRYPADKLLRRAERIVAFILSHLQLFPPNLVAPEFQARFLREVPLLQANEMAIKRYLYSKPDLIALCHWNANIDNGWYWRDPQGELQCGLMDWGRVGQMTVAQGIYGAFSGAIKPLWHAHFDEILRLFITEYARSGGPALDFEELKDHTALVTATMGLAYLMDAPAMIERQLPDLDEATGPEDPRFTNNEDARVPLHMLTMFLNQWQTQDFGARAARALAAGS